MEVEAAYPLSFIPYCKGMPFPTSFLFLIEGTQFKEVSWIVLGVLVKL